MVNFPSQSCLPKLTHSLRLLILGAATVICASSVYANSDAGVENQTTVSVPNFSATFVVHLYGMDLGFSKHNFHCDSDENNEPNCSLTTDTKPQGFAGWFVKDYAVETIAIKQSANEFLWQGYQKQVIRAKGSDKKDKFQTYKVEKQQVTYLEKNRQWTWNNGLFDTTSIAYAIQWYALNKKDLNQAKLMLQSSSKQYPLHFSEQYKKSQVQLEYERVTAENFRFDNERYEIDLWLLPKAEYFPGKVRIHDKEEDQTLTLTLQKAPEFK